MSGSAKDALASRIRRLARALVSFLGPSLASSLSIASIVSMVSVVSMVSIASIAGVPIARADDAEEARFHDELARRHYAARRYEQAIREFFLERALAPNPRITFNLALCFDALHREADAYLLFSEYLAGDDADPERHRLADDALARLTPRVALIAITSEPLGATVFLDRREHGAYGVTPLVVPVEAGEHTVRLEREGYASSELTVRAALGARVEGRATLTRIVGHLEVGGVAGAQVDVRDAAGTSVARGVTPLRSELPPGDYEVEVQA
ncbi:MAG: PEGA domain-containing protein, partial [Sandaracinaceae bacterium]|nr:PEGA domain-containing protein [Sandaracinaceae bacterium]